MELSAAAFTHAASVNLSVDVLDHICVLGYQHVLDYGYI